nr:phospholipase-like protein [Tanacetum cinerariifolium]
FFVFMGFELRHVIANKLLGLVDDLSARNDFPWGEYIWIELHKKVYNNDSKYRERHLKKLAVMGPTFMPTSTLQGFVFAFKVRNRLRTLTPSSDEMKQKWWKMSLEHNVSKASTSSDGPSKKKSRVKHKSVVSHTHVRTKVHREVDVRTNVHHDVDEANTIPYFSMLTSDSHVTNAFSNSMEFDDHVRTQMWLQSVCLLIQNAGNKESMCVDSSVKTSCATDINANNVHNDSMDLDHDPKVVEQNEFDQNVADKNLIHDFDQTVE